MKTIYKILFSMCSTLVCAIYSVRSFAASFVHPSCSWVDCDDYNPISWIGNGEYGVCPDGVTVESCIRLDAAGHVLKVVVCNTDYCLDDGGLVNGKGYYPDTVRTVIANAYPNSCVITYKDCVPCPVGFNNMIGQGGNIGITYCYMPKDKIFNDNDGNGKFKFTDSCYYSVGS